VRRQDRFQEFGISSSYAIWRTRCVISTLRAGEAQSKHQEHKAITKITKTLKAFMTLVLGVYPTPGGETWCSLC
jgi:hypothetical protein